MHTNPPWRISTNGPEECQNICRRNSGCAWFTWEIFTEGGSGGNCTLLNRVTNVISNYSTKGIVSGPARCGGMKKLKKNLELN